MPDEIKKIKILAVDDDEDLLKLIEMFLKKKGYDIKCEPTGKNALDIVNSFEPDIIILDFIMPGMDGGKTFLLLQEKFDYKLPTIFLTGTMLKLSSHKVNPKISRYLRKPFDFEELDKLIKDILSL